MQLLDEFTNYFQEIFNIKINKRAWKQEKSLPFFLKAPYSFYEISIKNTKCLLIILRNNIDISPGEIKNHLTQIQEKYKNTCIFVLPAISAYSRKKLIQHKISFVIPKNQMYIPNLCLDLREYFKKTYTPKKFMSPATQALIIYLLNKKNNTDFFQTLLAKKLDYSAMSMTRAFNELEFLEIGEKSQIGKKCTLRLTENNNLWEKALPHMSSPIKKKIFLKRKSKNLKKLEDLLSICGISALSHYSTINPSNHLEYAIYYKNIDLLLKSKLVEEVLYLDEADIELEVWNYNPKTFAQKNLIDPFSLYLSLKESNDERIETALEKMMEKII
jgi:hypothetical protein